MKILAVGDIMGERAVAELRALLSAASKKHAPDMIVVNGENAAGGRGLVPSLAADIFAAGADVITTGNHIWDRDVIQSYLDSHERVLRPANYPDTMAGVGYCIVPVNGLRVLVINVSGTAYMKEAESLANPYDTADRILSRESGRYDFALVDIHAEATGEKLSFARYLDEGPHRVAAVWGTHTHIPTADACILPNGTGYVTDLGMTGPRNGVLGVKTELILRFSKDKLPCKFEVADGEIHMDAVLFDINIDIDPDRPRAVRVVRI